MEKLYEGYQKLLSRDDYKNFKRNRSIAEGKTTKVFYPDVIQRVRLEYTGAVNELDEIMRYENGKFISTKVKLENMIVGSNILQDISKLYSEKAADKDPEIVCEDDIKIEWVKQYDITEMVGELVFSSSYGGAVLIKGIYNAEKNNFSYYAVKRDGFFELYDEFNPSLVNGYIIFSQMEDEDKLLLEIYREGSTEYRCVTTQDENWRECQYPYELTGMKREGKGYINKYKGWQVGYVRAYSDYNNDLISNVREIVVQDTTTSQAFSKCLTPKVQVPESVIEYDGNNRGKININDGIVAVGNNDKDIKQIQFQTNVEEWNIQRQNLFDNIYKSTKTNANVFGISTDGSDNASGASKERSMESLISLVRSKRNKCYRALETVFEWGYNQVADSNLGIVIEGIDVLELSEKEKAEIEGLKIDNLIKLDKYLGEEEVQAALKDLKSKLLDEFRK